MFCRHCGLDLPDDSKFCVRCGKPCLAPPASPLPFPKALVRWGVFAGICALVAALTAIGTMSYRQVSALRSSLIYRDALAKAQNSPGLRQTVGGPLRGTGLIMGYLHTWGDEGSGFLVSPLLTPAGVAMLHAQLYRSSGVWRYRELEVTPFGSVRPVDLLQPPADDLSELHANGRLYLVALGTVAKTPLPALAEYLQKRFAIPITTLSPLPLDESVLDLHRGQIKAEEVFTVLQHRFPEIAANDNNLIIAITETDMYAHDWAYAFNQWDKNLAVISTHRLDPHFGRSPSPGALLPLRTHKLLERDLGLLYYQLPFSADPTSVLYQNLDDVSDVDVQRESLTGLGSLALVGQYPAASPIPPIAPVVRKMVAQTEPGRDEYPCVVFEASAAGSARLQGKEQACRPPWFDSKPVEQYEVDLRGGRFVLHQTDLFLADTLPLALTRAYSSWWDRSLSFGIGSSHAYDLGPVGSRNPYTYLSLILADGTYVYYPRISEGTSFRDALYEHTNSSGIFYQSQIRWNGDGWDLKFPEGALDRFPEAYWSRNLEQGALVGMRASNGDEITVERNAARQLVSLTSPHHRQIRFAYDGGERIVRATSNDGHTVDYVYDPGARLVRVLRDGAGFRHYTYRFNYLLTVENGAGQKLLTVDYYDNGRIKSVSLPDASIWRFSYVFGQHKEVTATEIVDPAGRRSRIEVPPIPRPTG